MEKNRTIREELYEQYKNIFAEPEGPRSYRITMGKSTMELWDKEIKKIQMNEIKKLLYKEKPDVHIYKKDDKFFYYSTKVENTQIKFKVPIEDMGDHRFKGVEPSQLLIRWITLED